MTILDTHAQGEPRRRADTREDQVEAGGAHLLGLWAGGLMGLEEAHLQDYAAAVAASEKAHPETDAALNKVARDLEGAGLKVSEGQIRGKLNELQALTRGQLGAGA